MKLDYLQFLELEVFTRFGARLEASMEKAIRRGRSLREILKQDRLSPLPETAQMAWLVAFNDGCFEDAELDEIPAMVDTLMSSSRNTFLGLAAARQEWSDAVASWLSGSKREDGR